MRIRDVIGEILTIALAAVAIYYALVVGYGFDL
jgi:hypothetical protein